MPDDCTGDQSFANRLCILEGLMAQVPSTTLCNETLTAIHQFRASKPLYEDEPGNISALHTYTVYPKVALDTPHGEGGSDEFITVCEVKQKISESIGDVNKKISDAVDKAKTDLTQAFTDADKAITKEYKEADTLIKSEITNAYTEADKTVLTKTVLLESENQQVIKSKIKFNDEVEFAKSPLSGNVAYIDKTNTFKEDQNFDKDVYTKGTFRADNGGTFYKGLDVFSDNLNVNEGNLNVPQGTISGALLKLTENTDPSVLDAAHCTKLCVLKKASEAREDINYDFYVDDNKTAYFGGEVTFKKFKLPESSETEGRLKVRQGSTVYEYTQGDYIIGQDLFNLGFSYFDS